MTGDDLLPVPADVDTRHLGGAVGVDGGQVNEPPRVHGCPRDLVEPNRTVSHRLPLMKTRDSTSPAGNSEPNLGREERRQGRLCGRERGPFGSATWSLFPPELAWQGCGVAASECWIFSTLPTRSRAVKDGRKAWDQDRLRQLGVEHLLGDNRGSGTLLAVE